MQQARSRPRALAEATALHGALILSCPGRPRWIVTSWTLTTTHLGLLGPRRTLGAANAITILRGNLPTVAAPCRWLAVIALGTDLLDGQLARRGHAETLFGVHADSLADAAFWLWFAARHEPSRLLRAAACGAWAAPILAVTAAAVLRGRMTDPPHPGHPPVHGAQQPHGHHGQAGVPATSARRRPRRRTCSLTQWWWAVSRRLTKNGARNNPYAPGWIHSSNPWLGPFGSTNHGKNRRPKIWKFTTYSASP